MGGVWRNWLRYCATRREVPCWIPDRVHGNFQVNYFFCPHSVAVKLTHRLTEVIANDFVAVKVRLGLRAENSAILVVSNVKLKKEAQHSIPLPSLHDFLRGKLFILLKN